MKNIKKTFLFTLILCVLSCSKNDANELTLKDHHRTFSFECDFLDDNNLLNTTVGICMDGIDVVAPNQTFIYACLFSKQNGNFEWDATEGMQIENISTYNINDNTISEITIKFTSDFSGGFITVKASNSYGSAKMRYPVVLESK
ncbi:hypothetical protein [uncultured Tenacibaculum sp.]|uniref:hypothetical protein n=1 Tax=uncultured Tenacibaculum sp. TaxID=174713 RepID=UPI002609AC6A|nr:hypothetical protein [uncultured Tenacibaculum sp.]